MKRIQILLPLLAVAFVSSLVQAQVQMCDLSTAAEVTYGPHPFRATQSELDFEPVASSRSSSRNMGIEANLFVNHASHTKILAFVGTASASSIIRDFAIGVGDLDHTADIASNVYGDLLSLFPDYTLYVTGHSLGGIAAQIIAGKYGVPGAAFNTFSYKAMKKYRKYNPEFYVHNTEFAGQNIGPYYIGRLIKHTGFSHSIETLNKKHFDRKCQDSRDSCHESAGPKDLEYHIQDATHRSAEFVGAVVTEGTNIATKLKRGKIDEAIGDTAKAPIEIFKTHVWKQGPKVKKFW